MRAETNYRDYDKVLVAGGTGPTGRLIVERLMMLGIATRVMSRAPERANLPREVEVVLADVLVEGDCQRAVVGCDAVIACLSQGRKSINRRTSTVHCEGMFNLVHAAVSGRAPRFVLVSSLGVGDSWKWMPRSAKVLLHAVGMVPLLKVQFHSEEALNASNLAGTILRAGIQTSGEMRTEPLVTLDGHALGLTSRQAVADTAVRSLRSVSTIRRTLMVIDRDRVRWTYDVVPFPFNEPWVAW